jgi:MFS family permease
MAYLVFSSVTGSIVGPILGGFLESFAGGGWVFMAQLGIGLIAQGLHFFLVPETRSSVIVTREAKLRRKLHGENVFSKDEYDQISFCSKKFWKYALSTWIRPFLMFFTEAIVLFLSLISGFSDALIFTCLESLPMVMDLWDSSCGRKVSALCP